MSLTIRDKRIMTVLQNQEFCFYKDIKRKFFSSKSSACNRLNVLQKKGYIEIKPLSSITLQKNLDNFSIEFIGRNLKIISLSDKYKPLRRKLSPWKTIHQILLFSLREKLEVFLNREAFFENQNKKLEEHLL